MVAQSWIEPDAWNALPGVPTHRGGTGVTSAAYDNCIYRTHIRERRQSEFARYRVDAALMERADANAVFMHCLPAHRGEEVAESVIEGPRSAVWDQAENRLHVQKAIMATLMGEKS